MTPLNDSVADTVDITNTESSSNEDTGSKGKSSTVHWKTLEWVNRALEEGRISKDEFDVLYYAARKVDWRTMEVHAYSAAQVCRSYNLDATITNRQRFTRAKDRLKSQNIVRDDYRHCRVGNERTYTLYLPWSDPFAVGSESENERLSLYRGMYHTTVSHDVPTCVSVIDTNKGGYGSNSDNVSQPMYHRNEHTMFITNQGENSETERDPLNPLRGLAPSAPVGGRSAAAGLLKGYTGKAISKALSPAQCEGLTEIIKEFRALWSKYRNGFDPEPQAVFKLLKYCSPLEVLCACRSHLPERAANSKLSRFFADSARNIIEQSRKKGTHYTFSFRNEAQQGDHEQLDDFYVLTRQWCELFQAAVPDTVLTREITSGDVEPYTPKSSGNG